MSGCGLVLSDLAVREKSGCGPHSLRCGCAPVLTASRPLRSGARRALRLGFLAHFFPGLLEVRARRRGILAADLKVLTRKIGLQANFCLPTLMLLCSTTVLLSCRRPSARSRLSCGCGYLHSAYSQKIRSGWVSRRGSVAAHPFLLFQCYVGDYPNPLGHISAMAAANVLVQVAVHTSPTVLDGYLA